MTKKQRDTKVSICETEEDSQGKSKEDTVEVMEMKNQSCKSILIACRFSSLLTM